MIPEEEISFEDKRPYHTIDMYKTLFQLHIGLQVRSMALNMYPWDTPNVGDTVRGSFPKQAQVDPSYKRCGDNDDNDETIKFPIEVDVEFTYLGAYSCFFMLCKTNVQVYRYKNTLFIIFEAGERALGIHKTDDVYEQPRPYGLPDIHKPLNYDALYKMLHAIHPHFDDIDQLVLSGHSNGMAAATLFSYLLCGAKDDTFLAHIREKLDEKAVELIEKCKIGINRLRDEISLFVVGTGGFPVLFESKDEFRQYYDMLKGRYVHIVCGYREDNTIYLDNFADYLHCLLNVKFGVYYLKTEDEHNIYSYAGEKCAYDVIIDDVILPPNYERVKQSRIIEDFYNESLDTRVGIYEEIMNTCESYKSARSGYKLSDPEVIKRLEQGIELACDDKYWIKRTYGNEDVHLYKDENNAYYHVPESQLYHYVSNNGVNNGVNIRYIPGQSQRLYALHVMKGYRSILSIYFFS